VSQRYIVEATAPGYERASERLWIQPSLRRRIILELAEAGEAPFDSSSQAYWFRGKPRAREEVFKARQLRVKGDSESAISRLERALEHDPHFSVAHNELGLCYVDLNQLDEAQANFARAFELGPALIHFLNLTDVLQVQGDHIAGCIDYVRRNGFASIDATEEAEEWWVQEVIANRGKTSRNADCTPGYYNFEGEEQRRQDGNYNGSFPQYIAHVGDVLAKIEENFDLSRD
jgi:tetratricopeptide (TPR) repeat protein